jgi:hypothetical protein
MKKTINSFWYDKWTNEKQIKSTLEYLEIQQNPIGTPHNILRSVKNRKYDIQKAEIQKLLMAFFIAFFHCCFFGGFSIISSGDGGLYFWSVFLILQMNKKHKW